MTNDSMVERVGNAVDAAFTKALEEGDHWHEMTHRTARAAIAAYENAMREDGRKWVRLVLRERPPFIFDDDAALEEGDQK